MLLSTAEKMYGADRSAIRESGIPSLTLMQNAAGHLARTALEVLGQNRTAAVFCGPGNNGGDGVAAAAYLLQSGVRTRVFLVGDREKLTPDTRAMEERLTAAGGALEPFDPGDAALPAFLQGAGVLVDAIFGIGLHRPVEGAAREAIRLMNASGVPAVAADIPSGVSADTGLVLGDAVRCARTVTFSLAKPGHFLEPGCVYCGRVEVCPIGIPAAAVQAAACGVEAVTARDARLPARAPLTHKGDYGRLLIAAGSVGYTGAPNLCARAAVRAGAGLVSLGVPRDIWAVCAGKNDEAMPFPLPCDEAGRLSAEALPELLERLPACGSLVLGPGLGRSAGVRELVKALLRAAACPVVLDADGLWAVSDDPETLREAAGPVVVTPHAGEFARLGGALTGERLGDAGAFAARYGCVTVLKGHRTVIAFPDGGADIIAAGNPGMARGGSGDVLSGVLGALLGQLPLRQAVTVGAYIHAAAGDACAAERGEYGMTPSDMIEKLPFVMKGITR